MKAEHVVKSAKRCGQIFSSKADEGTVQQREHCCVVS